MRTERDGEVVRELDSALVERVALRRDLGAEDDVRREQRIVGAHDAADSELRKPDRNGAEVLDRRVVGEELVIHTARHVRQELDDRTLRRVAQFVLVRRQAEVRRCRRLKATAEDGVVRRCVVMTNDETRRERQVGIHADERVAIGVLPEHLLAGTTVGEPIVGGGSLDRIKRRLGHELVRCADVRAGRGLVQLLDLAAGEQEELVLEERATHRCADVLRLVGGKIRLRARQALGA